MKTRARPAAPPQVAVLVGTSTQWGRQVVTGIQNYARTHGPWFTFIEPRGVDEPMSLPRGWTGQGIIARVGNDRMAAELRVWRCPVVNVSGIRLSGRPFPCVTTDHRLTGRMAAVYFLRRGYQHFAYFSLTGLAYVTLQHEAYTATLRAAGRECHLYAVRPRHDAEPDWSLDLTRLGAWLRTLPKPVAILVWNASSSRELLYAAHVAGVRVPEDVAVLSGTDDDLFCESAFIPISGIRIPGERIGFQAAALLARLMRGAAPPRQPILLEPLGLKTRRSTDTLAIHDAMLLKAMGFIRAHAGRPLHVAEVSRHAGVSRRLLERKFHAVMARSPAAEVRRAHLERARELLERTDLPVPEVAEASGFGSPEHFAYAFKRAVGLTPLKYRRNTHRR